MFLATSILVLTYAIIFSDKINRAVIALLGACAMIIAGVLTQNEAVQGIDFNAISLLVGMMIIVAIVQKSGVFQYIAIWCAQKVKANPRGLLVILTLMTAGLSTFLDNVTTVLLISPIIFQIVKTLKITPYPFLYFEIFASNIGGTATLIGDPPNILIGSTVKLSFMDFIFVLMPVILIILGVLIVIFDFIWKKSLTTRDEYKAEIIAMNPAEYIKDSALLKKSLAVLCLTVVGFICSEFVGLENGTIAMCGASILMFVFLLQTSQDKAQQIFDSVDWTTIFFFCGLFVIVYGVEKTHLLSLIGTELSNWSNGSVEKATYLVLTISALVSSVIDNIPFVATAIPVIKSMESDMGGHQAMQPVWWALSLGSCLGGNGTLIGASANIIIADLADKEGYKIGFIRFLIWSVPVMLLSVAISAMYLYVRFF